MFKVIIVDDELSVKRSLKNIIEQDTTAFRVVAFADDGREALSIMDDVVPDLVITDIRMPVMDGMTLVQEIRSRGIPTELLMISGFSDFSYAKRALQFGVTDYILKPIDVDEVSKALSRIADKLYDEQRKLVERSEWFAYCKSAAEKMMKYLWVLNESAVWSELEDINNHLRKHHFNALQLKEIYMNLLILLQTEIDELSGGRIQIQTSPDYEWNGQEEILYGHVQSLIRRAMDDLRKTRNWGSHNSITEAVKQIETEYSNESFSLKDAAELVGMSPSYFSKSFKEELGVSYTHYIAKLRMDKAIELLSDPANKVYEVAYGIGYSEYAHFAKVFKKYYGFSPTDYRNQLDPDTRQ